MQVNDTDLKFIDSFSTILLSTDIGNYSSIEDHEDVDYGIINNVYIKKNGRIWRRIIKIRENRDIKYKFVHKLKKYKSNNQSRLLCKVPILRILGEELINLESSRFNYWLSSVDIDRAGFIWVTLGVRKWRRGGRDDTKFENYVVLDANLEVLAYSSRSFDNKIPFVHKESCNRFLKCLYNIYPEKEISYGTKKDNYVSNTNTHIEYDIYSGNIVFKNFDDMSSEEIIQKVKNERK